MAEGSLDSILSTSTQDAEKLYTARSLPLWLRLCRVGNRPEISYRLRICVPLAMPVSPCLGGHWQSQWHPESQRSPIGKLFPTCSLALDCVAGGSGALGRLGIARAARTLAIGRTGFLRDGVTLELPTLRPWL